MTLRQNSRSSEDILSDSDNSDMALSGEPAVPASQVSEIHDGETATEGGENVAYNRKEKSLGELCRRFLFLYGTPQKGLLYLDQCTRELGVERRRIYDIINILESFSVIRRCAKNEYKWRGIDKIIYSIEQQIAACVSLLIFIKIARNLTNRLIRTSKMREIAVKLKLFRFSTSNCALIHLPISV